MKPGRKKLDGPSILLLDIETAPNLAAIWSPFTRYIPSDHVVQHGYLLCWAAKWLHQGQRHIMFEASWDSSPEDISRKLWELVDEADAVCHFNGTKFDMPVLKGTWMDIGLPPPSGYKDIDLLRTSRQARRFSHKLNDLSKRWGYGEKIKHEGMGLWLSVMNGDKAAQARMARYNKMDVTLLERLYYHMRAWVKGHPNHALYKQFTPRPTCTNCGSGNVKLNGHEYTQVGRYQRYRCLDCGTPMRGRTMDVTHHERLGVLQRAA